MADGPPVGWVTLSPAALIHKQFLTWPRARRLDFRAANNQSGEEMYLTQDQRDAYARDGFIILPNLVSMEEVGRIKRDLARACDLRDDRVVREKGSDAVRMIYGMNECDGPTGSQTVADLSCSSRLLQSAKDILGE